MKWVCYIFSFYLLYLSGFTCKAESDCCKEEISQRESRDHEDGDHHAHSPCVPFLACGACNSVLPAQISIDIPAASVFDTSLAFCYIETSWTNAPKSIWQPPQIA